VLITCNSFTAAGAQSAVRNFQARHALLIGVGAYPADAGIAALQQPAAEVASLKQVLEEKGVLTRC